MELPIVRGEYKLKENLAKYSFFGCGGNVDVLFIPQDQEDLISFLKQNKMPITILGGGANTLVRDGGLEGVAILTRNLNSVRLEGNSLIAEAGAQNGKLFNFAKKHGKSNFEFLGTIPGTVGGACRMNAGCYGSEIKDLLQNIKTVDFEGNVRIFSREECNFEYRHNNLPDNLIFLEATFTAEAEDTEENIDEKFKSMMAKRLESQPHGVKTCGSTFKNTTSAPAWKIIQEIGMQGKEINGAIMSPKHANFMVNLGTATATDLESLTTLIQEKALEEKGVKLELEIKIIGKK